jgi:hypothetical protein
MILSEFHDLVRDSAKRGDTIDTLIPRYVKMAVTWIERNWSFKYMEQLATLRLVAADRVVELDRYIKGVKFVRFTPFGDIADYTYLSPVDNVNVVKPESGVPAEFYILGHNKLVFNPIPDIAYEGEVELTAFTDWPTADDSRHYLLDIGTDLLLSQTLMMLAVTILRDPKMIEGFRVLREESIRTMLSTDDEMRYTGADLRMGYRPFYTSR